MVRRTKIDSILYIIHNKFTFCCNYKSADNQEDKKARFKELDLFNGDCDLATDVLIKKNISLPC